MDIPKDSRVERIRKQLVMTFELLFPGNLMIVNLAAAGGMFAYTSYLDLKTREVDDKVWIVFAILALTLQGLEVWWGFTSIVILLISVALASLIGMGLYYFGFYGGADGKALIVLALFVPSFVPRVGMYAIAPLIVLTNGVLISMLLPLSLVVVNVARLARGEKIFQGFEEEPTHRKLLACLLGYKQHGKPRSFQFSLEKFEESRAARKFDFSLMKEDFEEKSETWVTPGIPLLVFFGFGYAALIFYGDLVVALIQFIVSVL